ncbi:39S ribosomal protein L39, mitochondrial [Nilaparvata lugens]|uniref:39S ribosomal protein L39, mitochondrial n=1 Tax=Nilaparvata lugens TaxID=108931 RepID=UPI00193DC371|nr:39S ribosomal protein L39, mitochondrial [Nilaparvata lugens]
MMHIFTRLSTSIRCSCKDRLVTNINLTKSFSSGSPAVDVKQKRQRRNEIFDLEKKRQREQVGRIEKISVSYKGPPENMEFVMNRGISTPFNVAQHISEGIVNKMALALLDDTTLWDMHRPLESDCTLQLLHFEDQDPFHVNKAFWRTCSFVLGAVADNAFKDHVPVSLHSFPPPNVKSGSFVYDVKLGLDDWVPVKDDLRTLSAEFVSLAKKDLPLERLEVTSEVALEMFADNSFKVEQIPDIASNNPSNTVTVYRAGDHIDISRGPMVAGTGFIGRATITAVHQIETDLGQFYRFQGVALPRGIMLNHFGYSILEDRARKLNSGRLPNQTDDYFTPPGSSSEMAN